MSPATGRLEFIKHFNGLITWRLSAGNGRILVGSACTYKTLRDARRGYQAACRTMLAGVPEVIIPAGVVGRSDEVES